MNILPCYLNGRLSTCKKPRTTSQKNISRAPDTVTDYGGTGCTFVSWEKSQYSWGDWEIHTAKGGDIVSNECVFVACMEEIKTENNITWGEKKKQFDKSPRRTQPQLASLGTQKIKGPM